MAHEPMKADPLSDDSIKKILIVGAGWVGRQIAAKLAQESLQVRILDHDREAAADAIQWIQSLESAPDTSRISTGESVGQAKSWKDNAAASKPLAEWSEAEASNEEIDLVIECVPEQLSIKRRVLGKISHLFPPPTKIVSNSSYFVPSLFAPHIAAPERYAHLHFHVPVLRDSIVDISGCEHTAQSTITELKNFVEALGVRAIVLRKEHPGYVFNWMLQAVLQSALELAALDVVDIEEVDLSWKSVTGMPLGPFEMMDQIGLDVVEQVLANARWAPPLDVTPQQLLEVLQAKTKNQQLGRKTLEGFYKYDNDTQLH